ncbi:hypothetical protein PG996_009686 [Apiospora saccharicola]|uniref:C2H2-type domain-containing protein n=1 Tax=Apiospora saccharicola TaxID=335842 RepID=A0ABR1ULI3_9PEZI
MSQVTFQCPTCYKQFDSCRAREQHMEALRHEARNFKCDVCPRSFPTRHQVEAHMRTPGNWHDAYETKGSEKDGNGFCVCGTCWRGFDDFKSRDLHLDALNHEPPEFECNVCELYFQTKRQVEEHMNAEGHWSYAEDDEGTSSEDTTDSSSDGDDTDDYECGICDEVFDTDEDCTKHEALAHKWCYECEEYFATSQGAWMHRNSDVHTGTPTQCPFCNRHYMAIIDLCQHLESGGCRKLPNPTNRQIYELVRSRDPGGIIAKNRIKWHQITYEASGLARNGSAYECGLCHEPFSSLAKLNEHLRSPVRKSIFYMMGRELPG